MKEILGKSNVVAAVSRYQSGLPLEREENQKTLRTWKLLSKNTK
jgi:hypothetical protein